MERHLKKLRVDPELANAKFITADGKEFFGNRDYLRACSSTLYDMLGEDVDAGSTAYVLLPPIITSAGFNAVLEYVFSSKGSVDVLIKQSKVSIKPSKDEFCKTAVETLVAADYLGVSPDLVDKVGELVMRQCTKKAVNPLQVFSLLNGAGSQRAFVPLMEQVKEHVQGHFAWHFTELHCKGTLLCSAVLGSEELGEFITAYLAARGRDGVRCAFDAMISWCKHKDKALGIVRVKASAAYDGSSWSADPHLKTLFSADHLSHLSFAYLRTVVEPSKLVRRTTLAKAYRLMAAAAEKLSIDFEKRSNKLVTALHLRQAYVTWDMQTSVHPEAFGDITSQPFPYQGSMWELSALIKPRRNSQEKCLHIFINPAGKSNWGAASTVIIQFHLVLLPADKCSRPTPATPIKIETEELLFTKEDVASRQRRGYAVVSASKLTSEHGYLSTDGRIRVQLRDAVNNPDLPDLASRMPEFGGQPFDWDPQYGWQIENHSRVVPEPGEDGGLPDTDTDESSGNDDDGEEEEEEGEGEGEDDDDDDDAEESDGDEDNDGDGNDDFM
eukprot:jgi/Tetstr1/430807/TSEL_020590.t1